MDSRSRQSQLPSHADQSPCSSSQCSDPFQCFLPSPFSFSSLQALLPPVQSPPSSSQHSATFRWASVSIAESLKSRKTPGIDGLLRFWFPKQDKRRKREKSTSRKTNNAESSWRTCPSFPGSLHTNSGLHNYFRGHPEKRLQADTSDQASKQRSNDRGPNARLDSLDTMKVSKHLFAGAMSAVVSRTLVAPLERLKLEYIVRGATAGVLDVVRMIFATEGVKGFWKGNFVNLIRTAPFKSINFYAYDTLRKQITALTGRKEITNFEKLAAGASAGILATIICFPMDTVRTRMVAPGGEAMGGIIGCFRHIIRNHGLASLYAGLTPALMSMAPAGAVFYGVYDILKTGYLTSPAGQEASRRRDAHQGMELDPWRTLLYGAIAGACAETVTYPFEVVRRHLQLQDAATRLGVLSTAKSLMDQGGIAALYAGLLPSTLQVLPSAALSYFVYEWMKLSLKVT